MTRSHKIGWLVLVLAVLFMLWRLPRLHGQGFGSFSHDQPFLAGDKVSVVNTNPPFYTNLQAWWHWEDVNTYATGWVDKISGYIISSDSTIAGTNDGTGVYYSGGAYGTNENVEPFRAAYSGNAGVGTFIVCKLNGLQNTPRFLVDTLSRYSWLVWSNQMVWNQDADMPWGGVGDWDFILTYVPLGEKCAVAFSLESNFGLGEGCLNGVTNKSAANVYELTHDRNFFGNSRFGTNPLNGWIYDILVYTNIGNRWSTSSTPTIASVWNWATNKYTPWTSSIPSGVIADYNLDEASGTRYDNTTNDYDLTDVGSVGNGTGVITNAALFGAGDGRYLRAANTNILAFAYNSPFSISLWVKATNNADHQSLVAKFDKTGSKGLNIYLNKNINVVSALLQSSATDYIIFDSPAFAWGNWMNVVVTWDGSGLGSGLQTYWNGSSNNVAGLSTSGTLGSIANTNYFTIGNRSGDWFISGLVDQVTVWNRCLTPAEASTLWSGGVGRYYPTYSDPH